MGTAKAFPQHCHTPCVITPEAGMAACASIECLNMGYAPWHPLAVAAEPKALKLACPGAGVATPEVTHASGQAAPELEFGLVHFSEETFKDA